MVKAALEACRGFNFFGKDGASWSVTYVDPDSSNRNKTTLESLLPRESSSKVIANLSFFFFSYKECENEWYNKMEYYG